VVAAAASEDDEVGQGLVGPKSHALRVEGRDMLYWMKEGLSGSGIISSQAAAEEVEIETTS
jgi:hypothetical protein